MKPRTYTTEGIVLNRRNFGEADRILVLYTKDYGRLSLIAKGIRRPKSKKRGHLEIFNKVKFQAVNGKGLDILTEAEVIDGFKEIRSSLQKISLAYYLMEVIGRITHDGEPNIELYNLILKNLEMLKSAKLLKDMRIKFISDILILMGYWPVEKKLSDPDTLLSEVIERQISSVRVGKRMLK